MALYQVHTSLKYELVDRCPGGRRSSDTRLKTNLRIVYENTLVLRQIGKFYNALDDDCYILFYLFGYKISNYKSGFPVSALNKVKNELEEKKISFGV